MKRYIEHIQNKDPHERRVHALHVASAITGFIFIAWVATLGGRLAAPLMAQEEVSNDQAAAVVQATERSGPRLEVSTSSVFLPTYQQ